MSSTHNVKKSDNEPVQPNTVVQDIEKINWIIKGLIDRGGFGDVYKCVKSNDSTKKEYAMKVETVDNYTICEEINFYIQYCKKVQLQTFKELYSLSHLAISTYVSFGVNQIHRFLILELLDTNLSSILQSNHVKVSTLLRVSVQLLHAIEYIHSKGYVHADIKSSNILLNNKSNNIYLIDYGLIYQYMSDGIIKPQRMNKKFLNYGTIDYCSVDVHLGFPPAPRGDIETIGYNLVAWMARASLNRKGSKLPWDNLLKRKKIGRGTKVMISNAKIEALRAPERFIQDTIKSNYPINGLIKYFHYCVSLKYTDIPDYKYIQQCICDDINAIEGANNVNIYTDVTLDWSSASNN